MEQARYNADFVDPEDDPRAEALMDGSGRSSFEATARLSTEDISVDTDPKLVSDAARKMARNAHPSRNRTKYRGAPEYGDGARAEVVVDDKPVILSPAQVAASHEAYLVASRTLAALKAERQSKAS